MGLGTCGRAANSALPRPRQARAVGPCERTRSPRGAGDGAVPRSMAAALVREGPFDRAVVARGDPAPPPRTRTDPAGFVAFLTYNPVREGTSWTITAPRPSTRRTPTCPARPMRNRWRPSCTELTHAAAASLSGPFTPTWLQEGLAELVADGRMGAIAPPDGVTMGSRNRVRSLPARSEMPTGWRCRRCRT